MGAPPGERAEEGHSVQTLVSIVNLTDMNSKTMYQRGDHIM